jgi:hypothetical protein
MSRGDMMHRTATAGLRRAGERAGVVGGAKEVRGRGDGGGSRAC